MNCLQTLTRQGRSLVVKSSRDLILRSTSFSIIGSKNLHTTQNTMSEKHQLAKRYEGTDKNLWIEFVKLAADHKALNLGQGFPDFCPPKYIRDALSKSAASESFSMHQYTRGFGHPRLVNALSATFSPILGRQVNPMSEVLISVGAYGSLYCAILGLVNPGDEVIIIEPFFDCYQPMVKIAGGVPVFVPLRSTKDIHVGDVISTAEYKLDPTELASKFTSKTKAIIVNNPNNPLGKVFDREELQMIADLCQKHDVVAICDDVYEWITYDKKFVKMATLPGMWERTLTIGSAGKTFSATGLKIGWTIGPEHLIRAMNVVHQNSIYCCPTLGQEAVAIGFEEEQKRIDRDDCYFKSLVEELRPKRQRMIDMLVQGGLVPIIPDGGYFILADFSYLTGIQLDGGDDEMKDVRFVKWLIKEKKLATIPASAFYCEKDKHLAENLIRLCFIKKDSTLAKAEEMITAWKGGF